MLNEVTVLFFACLPGPSRAYCVCAKSNHFSFGNELIFIVIEISSWPAVSIWVSFFISCFSTMSDRLTCVNIYILIVFYHILFFYSSLHILYCEINTADKLYEIAKRNEWKKEAILSDKQERNWFGSFFFFCFVNALMLLFLVPLFRVYTVHCELVKLFKPAAILICPNFNIQQVAAETFIVHIRYIIKVDEKKDIKNASYKVKIKSAKRNSTYTFSTAQREKRPTRK